LYRNVLLGNTNFKFNILFQFFTFLSTIKYTEHGLFECATVEHFFIRLYVYDKGSDDIYSEFFAASYVKRNYEPVISGSETHSPTERSYTVRTSNWS
jgi:hypothetical protein